jgi:tRNA A37 threonylcarbamoyladenosine dehydratase
LLGDHAVERLRGAHGVVVGLGGVGSWAAEALARSGVGRLTLVDLDHVAESNLNRQLHATVSTIGVAKVDAMRERILSIVPDCEVQTVDAFVTSEDVA